MAVVLLRCGHLEVLSCFSYTSPGSVQLLDSVGRLRPAEDPEGEAALHFALHLAMRGLLPKARESGVARWTPSPTKGKRMQSAKEFG